MEVHSQKLKNKRVMYGEFQISYLIFLCDFQKRTGYAKSGFFKNMNKMKISYIFGFLLLNDKFS